MDLKNDDRLSELDDLMLPLLRLPIKVVGREVQRTEDVTCVIINFVTRFLSKTMRGYAEFPLDIGVAWEIESFSQRYPLGSLHLLTSRDFKISSSFIDTWLPETIPLAEGPFIKYVDFLDEWLESKSAEAKSVKGLLPEILRPATKSLAEFSCNTIIATHCLHKIDSFLYADSGLWYSIRFAAEGNDIAALLERTLVIFADMITCGSLAELLIHIVAPMQADLLCLVGFDARIRSRLGETVQLFIGTTICSEEICTVALMGRR